jgi:EAL domain-containing protein (putative c-di-GMP-specific phosphodiesterase class I)/CheY-like chemotaxis protein
MSPPSHPALRVLHVEDSEQDVELALLHLRRSGYEASATRVESADAMREALRVGTWDVVFSDCSMPRFSAVDALALLRERALEIPFIIVSGTIAEETAAAAMRAGAHDFIRKDKMAGLGPAVERELRRQEAREAQKRLENDIRTSAARYRAIFEACPAPLWVYDPETYAIGAVNDAAAAEHGKSRQDLASTKVTDLIAVGSAAPGVRTRVVEIDGHRMAISVGTVPHDASAAPAASWSAFADVLELAARASRPSPAGPLPTRPSLAAALAASRILVTDDDADLLATCAHALTSCGCHVETAPTRDAARIHAERGPFDVIVTDVVMKGTSVLEFLRTVRERDADVPVLLVAASSDRAAAADAVAYGAFRSLRKPVAPATLLEVVRRAVELHKMATLKRQALDIAGSTSHHLGDRASLEVHFDRALDRLWLAFQPIVSWRQETVFGYEALVRSDEPTLARPFDLFTAAERLGRLHDLGRAIRQRVARSAPDAPASCKLFVNVHSSDLDDVDLISPSAPLTPMASSIVLEITERSSLEPVDGLGPRLEKLRRLGFQIALDDLGAGYAGVSSFSQVEPEIVKLDMSLVRGIDTSSRKRSVVRSMLDLAGRDLAMVVICEGVETEAERDTLAALGADLLQGYLFAKPAREFVAPKF